MGRRTVVGKRNTGPEREVDCANKAGVVDMIAAPSPQVAERVAGGVHVGARMVVADKRFAGTFGIVGGIVDFAEDIGNIVGEDMVAEVVDIVGIEMAVVPVIARVGKTVVEAVRLR